MLFLHSSTSHLIFLSFYFPLMHTNAHTVMVLAVVDVYQQWCGPCRAVVSLLRKIKNELGDDLLHFATVSPDLIEIQIIKFVEEQLLTYMCVYVCVCV